MRDHKKLMQNWSNAAWPYHQILSTFRRGSLIKYRKEKNVKIIKADSAATGPGFYVPKNSIAMIIKEPYEHESGNLICLQTLFDSKICENKFLSPNALLRCVELIDVHI